jgi:hypothetical protein
VNKRSWQEAAAPELACYRERFGGKTKFQKIAGKYALLHFGTPLVHLDVKIRMLYAYGTPYKPRSPLDTG